MMRWTPVLLLASAASVSPAQAQKAPRSPDAKPTFIEPIDAPHRHCAGACLKSGALHWFCRPEQTCSLDCNANPPHRHCHAPRPRPRDASG
jgi:hypothetical protein